MIKLIKTHYIISSEVLELILAALENHWFSDCGCRNNDDVILAQEMLEKEVKKTDEP